MRGMHEVRFEVTQEATAHTDGARWSCTPELGIHYAATDRAGNTVLTEDHVRGCMERAGNDPLALKREIGRASCRERGSISVGSAALRGKTKRRRRTGRGATARRETSSAHIRPRG